MTDGDRDEDAIGIAPEQPDVQNGVRLGPHWLGLGTLGLEDRLTRYKEEP